MAVSPREKNRILRCDLVQIAARWKLWRFPESLDPAAAGNPFARFRFPHAFPRFGEKILKRVCVFEIQGHLALADPENVAMRISETRRQRFTRQINNTGFVVAKFPCVCVCSYKNDAVAFDRDCFGMRLLLVNRVNIAVDENNIGGAWSRTHAAHKQQDSSDGSHQSDSFVRGK